MKKITIVVVYLDGTWDFVEINENVLESWKKTWIYKGKEVKEVFVKD